jgi:hypothetical protein
MDEGDYMEDKTPIYILSIVGIVALVAIIYMLAGSGSASTNYGNAITGNVVNEDIAPVHYGGFGRFVIAVALISACVYLYKKVE